ncbi:MAG: DegT/DnrJ/EryC1/StrS family aminotransferase [Candidatus Thermoplasmatota archaeon]|nr:DegT/DnrJ/EryC1/StrS family aminotransferase [Candidatus Thermoplasmatota archaeon]
MEFCDLKKQYAEYKEEIQSEINDVIDSASFINGPSVMNLESALASYANVKYAITCSSGTDALLLAFMAYDIQPGDEIICPAFTFIATASMIALYKAVPVFVDINPETFTIDVEKIEEKVTKKTKGIIPVSLYGQMPDIDKINHIAKKHNLWVMEDGAQSFGATYNGNKSCSLTNVATTSFFPAKPLGGYGDGGAIFTNDKDLADKLFMLRNHGQEERYKHKYIGINGRMDTIQAAIVNVKLRHFDSELKLRQHAADRYTEMLTSYVEVPQIKAERTSTWAQYTIRVNDRDKIRGKLSEQGIPTAVHYPIPLPYQDAFSGYASSNEEYPVSRQLSLRVLSLPMHALISEEEQREVCDALIGALNG